MVECPSLYIFTIITILLSASSPSFPSSSTNKLTPGQSISLNQTLLSDDQAFALGFFSSGHSNDKLYLAVWYNIPDKTIIWVANRDKPFTDPSATLTISNCTNLVLVNSKGTVLWSSNVNRNLTAISSASLLNTGNLVLEGESGNKILWQSFDYPTDTLLPGMRLYVNRHSPRLTSWRDRGDPSSGEFSCGLDPATLAQIFIWRGSKPHWRTSSWNGTLFFASMPGNSSASYVLYFAIILDAGQFYLTYSLSDSSANLRYTLRSTGQVEMLSLDTSSKQWRLLGSYPFVNCSVYGLCGPLR